MGEQLHFLFRHFLHSILVQTILPVVAIIVEVITIVASVANTDMVVQTTFFAVFAVVNVFECSCIRLRVCGQAVSHRRVSYIK